MSTEPAAPPADAPKGDVRPYYVFHLLDVPRTFEVIASREATSAPMAIREAAEAKFTDDQLAEGVKLWAVSAREFDKSARTVQVTKRTTVK
jgi:hypothetical protein